MHHVAPRTLQRLFRRYVGVIEVVLKRLRIHRAAERLTATSPPRWTELALELGYYDHAHFIRDFRLIVGRSPAEYAAEATRHATMTTPLRAQKARHAPHRRSASRRPAGAAGAAHVMARFGCGRSQTYRRLRVLVRAGLLEPRHLLRGNRRSTWRPGRGCRGRISRGLGPAG